MGRQKTISDEAVLGVARGVFRERGHTATTREIAQAAGISEAVLYQRFGSKDELFHAAMAPTAPDVEQLLGPKDPPDDAHAYLRAVVVRIGTYFAEILPLVVRLMTHPSFDPAMLRQGRNPRPAALLQEALAERLASLARRRRIAAPSPAAAARLLVSLAHDWGLGTLFSSEPPARRERELRALVDVVWEGLRARGP
jgi:AcrR family transcriptional regulator